MLFKYIGMLLGFLVIAAGGQAYGKSLSCDECREFDRERAQIHIEIAKKEREMERAFKRKEFRSVADLRTEINELRRKHLTLKGKESECKKACRPDVIKEVECAKIITELVGLDKGGNISESDLKKIDDRYKELVICNRELKKLREIHERGDH